MANQPANTTAQNPTASITMESCTKKMCLALTTDAGSVPFTLTSPALRLAWAKTGFFQSLTPDILAMVLDKEKTMPGPRQHMQAVVAELKEMYRHACWDEFHEPRFHWPSVFKSLKHRFKFEEFHRYSASAEDDGICEAAEACKLMPAFLFPNCTLRKLTRPEIDQYMCDHCGGKSYEAYCASAKESRDEAKYMEWESLCDGDLHHCTFETYKRGCDCARKFAAW
jgi:hypothetical protein